MRFYLENKLAEVASASNGDVLIYCPSPDMQAKEVDARLEIVKDRVLPLRIQKELFAYNSDLKVLEQYYQELWLIYIFVSPEIFKDIDKCQAIVNKFCDTYQIDPFIAYNKVRTHDFKHKEIEVSRFINPFHNFLEKIQLADVPHLRLADMLKKIGNDEQYLNAIKTGNALVTGQRLWSLLNVVVLENAVKQEKMTNSEKRNIGKYIKATYAGSIQFERKNSARVDSALFVPEETFEQYKLRLLTVAKQYSQKKT